MKKLILLLSIIILSIATVFSQSDCASALVLTPGTQHCGTNSFVGDMDDVASDNPCDSWYADGEYWFSYVGTGGALQLDVTNLSATYSGIYVLDGCMPAPTCIDYYSNGSSSADYSVTTPNLSLGATYYIVIANWSAPYQTDFCLDATALAPPAQYPLTNGGNTTTCLGTFLDPEGVANYIDHNATWTHTFCSGTAESVRFDFTFFDTKENNDYLEIFDGPDNTSTSLGTFANGNSPGIIISSGTCLTFEWTTDNNNPGGGGGEGWVADISCVPTPIANDECNNALNVPVNPDYSCALTTAGTVVDATASADANGCFGTSDDDVWFSFVATSVDHRISLINIAGSTTDMYHGIYSGTCGSLTEQYCNDGNESNLTGFTIGNTYYIRVYTWTATGGQTSTFDVCVGSPPPPPANDDCPAAVALTVNADQLCGIVTAAYTNSATNSGISACVGSGADDDVWFTFVATGPVHDIDLLNITGSSTDLVHEIFTGTCPGGLSSVGCSDPNSSQWSGFTIGNTYYVRVYTYYTGDDASFEICIGTPPPPPSNDEPCGAIILNVNIGNCSYQSAVLQTTATVSAGMPAPGCSSLGQDIWFQVTVPASGRLIIDLATSGGPTDMGMAWYTGPNCNNLNTLVECDDDDSQDGAMPMICRTGVSCTVPGDCAQNATLTPGTVIYVRIWEYGGGTFGPFDICAYEPDPPGAPSNCASAEVIAGLPFSSNNTTCCRNNNYNATDGCNSSYQDGEDFLYSYTPAVNEVIDITLTGTLTYTGIFVTDRCPGNGGANCIGSQTETAGNPLLCGVSLNAGTTYYIMVDTDPLPGCTPFNISISSSTSPTCGLNYASSAIAYAPDLNAGTNIALPIDDRFSSSYIPIGFPFCFDGYQHTQLLVSSNGYLIFDPVGCSSNLPSSNAGPGVYSGYSISAAIPNTTDAPRNCIMFPWQDIDPSIGGTIKYQTLGVTPNRRFVITFTDIPYYSCNALLFSGQVKLFETSFDIEIHVANKEVCGSWNGGDAIFGLHNYNGTVAITGGGVNYPTNWTMTNQAYSLACNCVGCIVPLPVELLSFEAKCNSYDNTINWTTASEINNDYYTLEKSNDGVNFYEIGIIEGAGNSNELTDYEYIDYSGGDCYYRLKQTDYDGTEEVHNIIYVNCEVQCDVTLNPNPSKCGEKVQISGAYKTIDIMDILGRKAEVEIIDGAIKGLPCGIYIVTIDGTYRTKLIVE